MKAYELIVQTVDHKTRALVNGEIAIVDVTRNSSLGVLRMRLGDSVYKFSDKGQLVRAAHGSFPYRNVRPIKSITITVEV